MNAALAMRTVLLGNLASSLMLMGLIWFVQIVHYPLMASVGGREFGRYEARHAHLTSLVVGPLMLVEAACALWLVFHAPGWAAWMGLALVGAIWLSTAMIQVPCHARLESGFDKNTHEWLVRSNWIRTVLWTLRGWIALFLVWRSLR